MSHITHLARNRSSTSRFLAAAAIAISLGIPSAAAGYADSGTGVRYPSDAVPVAPSPQTAGPSASQPIVSAPTPIDRNAGFDVGDAAVGAGVALGLVVLSGAGLAVRRHVRSTPQPIG
jgi:hypothetical protein